MKLRQHLLLLVGEDELPKLEVPQHYSVLMAYLDSFRYLSEELPGFRLPEALP